MANKAISITLAAAQRTLGNAIASPEIKSALAAFGYVDEQFGQGVTLLGAAQAHQHAKQAERANLLSAKDTIEATQRAAHKTYIGHVTLARVALRGDRGALEKLGLREQRSQQFVFWLAQAQVFYTNALANASITDRLAAFGMTATALTAGQAQVRAASDAFAARQQQRGVAQDATKQRDESLAALNAWMSTFRTVARVALKKRPDLLVQLGFTTHGAIYESPAAAPGDGATVSAPKPTTVVLSVEALPAAETVTSSRRNGKAVLNGHHGD